MAVLALLAAPCVQSQCTMTTGITTYAASCGGFLLEWQITGGTPPFQVSLSDAINGPLLNISTVSNVGSQQFPGATANMALSVVDAVACTASDNATTAPVSFPVYTFLTATDCNAGSTSITLELTNDFCEPNAVEYLITEDLGGGVTTTFASGLLTSGWTNTGPLTWLLNQALPMGRYTVNLIPVTNDCGFGTQCWGYPQSWPLDLFVVNAGDCGYNAFVRAALGGATGGTAGMRDDLRSAGLVPATEPYTALGYTYTGAGAGATITPAWLAATGPNAIVDWVVLEVRTSVAPYTLLRSKPAVLLRSGIVHDTDGDPYVNFGQLPSGPHRVVIRHRNHLAVMSGPATLDVQPWVQPVDFRAAAFSTAGLTRAVAGIGGCLWEGDVTGNGTIKYTGAGNDRDPILVAVGGNMPTNTISGQYARTDVNMDGTIKYTGLSNDRDPILQSIGGTNPTATRVSVAP